MQPDPVRSPSSIPIPDDVARWVVSDTSASAIMGVEPGSLQSERRPDEGEVLFAKSDLPKLYAHWAEGRVEAVARSFCVQASAVELAEGDQPCAVCVRAARAALGLEDRT